MANQVIERNTLIETMEKIFDPIPIPIILVDKKMKIQLINRSFTEYLGFAKEEMLGKSAFELDENTRWPIVFETKQAEIAWKHTFKNGKTAIVHRIPVLGDENEIAYGFGMILFETIENMKEIIQENKLLESKIKCYEAQLSQINIAKYTWDHIKGQSPSILQTKKIAKRASQTVSNVLLTGASGTGKELFAHAIHHGSKRQLHPFVKINCAAIPAQLIESELFGYETGAFTGAGKKGRKGRFELADGGSIFLDEIGDMPMPMQAKLLRVLQEKEFERIGGNRTIKVDVRVIAATNKDLKEMCENGGFRYDLYYRLNVMTIHIPPLRERNADIEILIDILLKKLTCKLNRTHIDISLEARSCLKKYHWPGNVRELENVLERAIILSDQGCIVPDNLAIPKEIIHEPSDSPDRLLKVVIETAEKDAIVACLNRVAGNRSRAAKLLGISRSSLYDRLEKLNL